MNTYPLAMRALLRAIEVAEVSDDDEATEDAAEYAAAYLDLLDGIPAELEFLASDESQPEAIRVAAEIRLEEAA